MAIIHFIALSFSLKSSHVGKEGVCATDCLFDRDCNITEVCFVSGVERQEDDAVTLQRRAGPTGGRAAFPCGVPPAEFGRHHRNGLETSRSDGSSVLGTVGPVSARPVSPTIVAFHIAHLSRTQNTLLTAQ
ncbi:hypothetical protein EYF80_024832 [Liparis tanakae]|uniref:Uncharacterized protein n=1 Tax=Liparis tanakae TaxID=230148 RepID=A0A4Z2HGE5_9TELE|nr:hypothetical protein EYF80_024832 [Liparis tanakae]